MSTFDLKVQAAVKKIVDTFFTESKERDIKLVNETAVKEGKETTDGSKIIRVSLGNNSRIKLRMMAVAAEIDPSNVFVEVPNEKGRLNIVLSDYVKNSGYTLDFRQKVRKDGTKYSAPVLKKVTA